MNRALQTALDGLCGELNYTAPDAWFSFLDSTQTWGRRTNLTAARDPVTLAELLFVDAVQMLRADWLPREGTWIDVGAGVGAPTIPIALCSPALQVTMFEPRRKRVAFLRHAIGALQLSDRVRVIEDKIDPSAPAASDNHDVALSRATFPPTEWLQIGAALASEVVVFGTDGPALRHALQEAGVPSPTAHDDYVLPSTGAPRTILKFDTGKLS